MEDIIKIFNLFMLIYKVNVIAIIILIVFFQEAEGKKQSSFKVHAQKQKCLSRQEILD